MLKHGGGNLIKRIGERVGPSASGIEAGLYACTTSVFASLATLLTTQQYFTVAEAMQMLATQGRLGAIATAGRDWFAIETISQFNSTERDTVHDGRVAFPWQVSLARAE